MQMQIAAELGIQPSMLRQWRAVLNGAAPRSRLGTLVASLPAGPVASPSDRAAEIARLRCELDRVRMERDVLEKAIGIFLGDAESEVRLH
jgi:transposase